MIWGGTIWGNCASGSPRIETSPAMTVTMAMTIDTIGRLIKKVDIIGEPSLASLRATKSIENCKSQIADFKQLQRSNRKFPNDCKSHISNCRFQIANRKSQIANLKYLKSQISNISNRKLGALKFAICNLRFAIFSLQSPICLPLLFSRYIRLRIHQGARSDLLHPLNDHDVPRLQSFLDDQHGAEPLSYFDGAEINL